MRFRDTLETGDRDIRVTCIKASNPENSCSHTYKACSVILDCSIADVFTQRCLCSAPRPTAGWVVMPPAATHAEGRRSLGAAQQLPDCPALARVFHIQPTNAIGWKMNGTNDYQSSKNVPNGARHLPFSQPASQQDPSHLRT